MSSERWIGKRRDKVCWNLPTRVGEGKFRNGKRRKSRKNAGNEGTGTRPLTWQVDCTFPCVQQFHRLSGGPMDWMSRVFRVPASETQMGLVMALCIFSLSVMSVALVWQAQVITKQNAVITCWRRSSAAELASVSCQAIGFRASTFFLLTTESHCD